MLTRPPVAAPKRPTRTPASGGFSTSSGVGLPLDGRPARHPGSTFARPLGMPTLVVSAPSPSPAEARAVAGGAVEFGAHALPDTLVLTARFADGKATSAAYAWYMDDESPKAVPRVTPNARSMVAILLVDSTTNVVLAHRRGTWSADFSRFVADAIARQADAVRDRRRAARDLDDLRIGFPSDARLHDAATLRAYLGD